MPRPRAPHGTMSAYRRHKKLGERVCDACQGFMDGKREAKPLVTPPMPPKRPSRAKPKAREVDLIAETLDNLQIVEDTLVMAANDDPGRVPALSKRRSELLKELIEYGGAKIAEQEAAKDPLAEFGEAIGDHLDNVSRIAAA